MVGGPEPVRLPAPGVNGWGLQPRYRTRDALAGRSHHDRHHDAADAGRDDAADDVDNDAICHHGPDGNCWRDNCHAIRDREEPGHVNRRA